MRSTNLKNTPSSIQIDTKLCEITGVKVLAFSHSCDLDKYENIEFSSIHHHTKFE